MPTRPNFLVICTDQMRADHMGCAGNRTIRTPNLDRLAAGGTHLPRAYVNCPLCMPSRATLFTGLTPRGHRVRTNGIPLDRAIPTMPGALSDAGYHTASFGKLHLTNYWLNDNATVSQSERAAWPDLAVQWRQGQRTAVDVPAYGLRECRVTLGHGVIVGGDYELWLKRHHPLAYEKRSEIIPSPTGAEGCATSTLDENLHPTAWVADETINFLRRHRRDRTGHPFYAMCSFPDPHHPYHVCRPWDRMYAAADVVPPVSRPGELDDLAPFFRQIHESRLQLSGRGAPTKMPVEHYRDILAHTYGMVSMIDKHLGRVLDALDESGLASETVVVFLSDHGDMMGDHGLLNKGPFHFEGLLRVPMIWRWPGRIAARRSEALASLLDFAPTILDLAGVPIPEGPRSSEAPQELPAWPGHSLAGVLAGRAEAVQESVVIENDEDYLGLRLRTLVTATHKLTTYTGRAPAPAPGGGGAEAYGELFDLANDPCELHNLWASPSHLALRLTLTEQLHHRLAQTDITLPRRLSHA